MKASVIKKLLGWCLMLTFFACKLTAQNAAGFTGERPDIVQLSKKITDELNTLGVLTPEQYSKVQAIELTYWMDLSTLGNEKLPATDMINKTAEIKTKRDNALKEIFTPEQWQKIQLSGVLP